MVRPAGATIFETVQGFYLGLLDELAHAGYTDAERSLLADQRLYYGRYLSPNRRNYFVETVIPHIAQAVAFLLAGNARPRILDLGCGLGMQSIIFASLGASVVGVDVRRRAIDLCEKRKAWYEERLGTRLEIEFVHGDFLKRTPEDFRSRFDALFSMAAFSCMHPLERTAKLISSILRKDAKIYLYEKNPGHPLHLLRHSPEPSPESTVEIFAKEGFSPCFLYGGCALPGPFWKSVALNQALVHPANNLLKKRLPLAFNYVLGLRRGRDAGRGIEHPARASAVLEAICFVDAVSSLPSFLL